MDSNARWDNEGYSSPIQDAFGAMQQSEVNGRHGYILHDTCWSLMERAFFPNTVPHARLFEVCDSLPFPMDGSTISWGHDYLGLVSTNSAVNFPWEDRFHDREFSEPDPVFSSDPYRVPEVDQILAEPLQGPPDTISAAPASVPTGWDQLSTLPTELFAAIAFYLATPDFLNARLASRGFWSIFYSQQFWASRFMPGAERSWLFEVRSAKQTRNWRSLYRRTNDSRIGPGLRNRKRIWQLIGLIQDILSLGRIEPLSSPVTTDQSGPATSSWTLVTGRLWEKPDHGPFSLFNEGCRLFHRQTVVVPQTLCRFTVSCVRVGESEYIAGISLTSTDGKAVYLGYRAANRQSFEASKISGFNLAVGSRGIQAIQCIARPGCTSPWLGCPHDSPKTKRLVVTACVEALEAGFDVSRVPSGISVIIFHR